MTEELKQEFEEKFTYGAEILLYDAKGRFVRSIEAPKLWNWISDQIKKAKIEENKWWFQMAGGENGRFIEYGYKDFQHRISELKGE